MADSATYTVSTVTRGMCLETRANGTLSTGVYDSSGKIQSQLWTIEQNDDGQSVAFKNLSNGQYLRSAGKGDGAKAQYGDKAWWTLEPGDAPALWWLKCNDTANYLANYGGSQKQNNVVQMWASNLKGWSAALQWYVHPSKPAQTFSFSPDHDSAISQKQKEEMEAKQKSLEDREQQIEAKEKAIKTQTGDIEAREKAVSEKASQLEKQREELDREQKTAAEKQQQLEKREEAIASKEARSKDTGGASKPSGSEPSFSGVPSDEVVQLRSRIAELEAQLEKNGPRVPSITRSNRQQRGDLRPIVMQQNFSHLPRLTDSELMYPLRVLPPATSVR